MSQSRVGGMKVLPERVLATLHGVDSVSFVGWIFSSGGGFAVSSISFGLRTRCRLFLRRKDCSVLRRMTWVEGIFKSPLLGNSCPVSKLCHMDSIQEVLMFGGVYCNFQLVEVCKLFQSSADLPN